ncbi:MAG TPA: MFS transporter [Caulobacteraceae bacterium]|jgi:MFS family permease
MGLAPATLRDAPGYGRFWLAASVSAFGDYFTVVAIQVMIVTVLAGTAADVGLVSGARWLPYMLFGLFAGATIDRLPRRPVMIATDLTRAALLVIVPTLALTHHLSIWALAGFMSLFGLVSLLGDAATQAFTPRLVPRALLTRAHARLDQSSAVAQTTGPALAGGLISVVGAPWAVIVDAASYLFSAAMLASIRLQEPRPAPAVRPSIWREVSEGAAYVYRHRTLAPLAIGTHAWFICNGAAGAIFVPFVLGTLHMAPWAVGLALSAAGVGALVGSLLAARLGERFGAGWVMIVCQGVSGAGYAVIALAPAGWLAWLCLGLGQFTLGFSIGAENANTLGYRQAVTPDALQGRMNATMRSINRAMVVFAAPLGGLLADAIGYRQALWLAAAGFVVVALAVSFTPLREARLEPDPALT